MTPCLKNWGQGILVTVTVGKGIKTYRILQDFFCDSDKKIRFYYRHSAGKVLLSKHIR